MRNVVLGPLGSDKAGLLVLPLILFHQLQLITGTVLARR